MEFWNHIINTALLGTDKTQISGDELSSDLVAAYEQISSTHALDKEEKFLQIVSVAFNYRQCGLTPFPAENIAVKKAEQEVKLYCNAQALQGLKDILEEQSYSLLKFWLQRSIARQRIVVPELIPALFEIAVNQKKLRPYIIQSCGKRGEWLGVFNPDWDFYVQISDEDIWQNGTVEQRRKVLQKIRETDPAKAREWLQQTWATENANAKAELLKQLETNISATDAEWLETLLEEKSQKVKESVYNLLKLISISSIVLTYWDILQKSILLKKEKALLGIVSKTSLDIRLSGSYEHIFKTGIEKLSSTKEFSDDEFILYQLIQFIPPSSWEKHFSSSPEQIISYFQKEKSTLKFLPALAKAVLHFKDSKWAIAFLQQSEVLYYELIILLPEKDQDKYSLKFFEKDSDNIIRLARERESEWSLELTKAIFKHAAKHFYQFNRSFYSESIHLIPIDIITELEKCAPSEEHFKGSWTSMSEYITKLIRLKQTTMDAFQS